MSLTLHRGHASLVTLLGVLLALLLGGSPGAGEEGGYLARLQQATDLLAGDLSNQARDAFTAANCDDYVDPLGWIGLGAATLAEGQVDGALTQFERAITLAGAGSDQARTAAPVARFARAICLLQRGQVAQARGEMARLTDEGRPWAASALAYAELAAGEAEAARRRAQAALETSPRDPLALAVLGRTLPGAQGITRLRFALAACPGSPYMAPVSGLALPNRTRPSIADATVRIDLRDGLKQIAGVTWLGTGEPEYFLLKVDGVSAGMSNSPPHQFGLPRDLGPGPHGVVIEAWGNGVLLGRGGTIVWSGAPGKPPDRYEPEAYSAALEKLRAALMPFPNRVHLHYWLGLACAAGGNQAQALASYERLVALDPGFADARQRLARLCRASGRRGPTRSLYDGPRRQVYVTFDDGPHPLYTAKILYILRRAKVRATFFLVGAQARAHPDLVRAIAAAGHRIANHSYSHDDMSAKRPAEVQQELLRTQAVIEDITGKRTALFRPPGGRITGRAHEAVAEIGYTTVMWSANVSVCAGLPAARGVRRLMQDVHPGAIILLHNGPDKTVEVLPGLLAALKKKGYSCGMLSATAGR